MCLLCKKTLSNEAMKPSRLQEHLSKIHQDKSTQSIDFFKDIKRKYEGRPTVSSMFEKSSVNIDKGLLASYKVSLLIAKCGKAHNIGETLLLPAVKVILDTLMISNASNVIKTLPLSNSSVSRRIDEMASDVEDQLCKIIRKTQFALQIDESTLSDNVALLLAYVRFINETGEMNEEMLFAKSLTTDTKGSSIFHVLLSYFNEKDIPLSNILACATDGAAAMTGRYRGFSAHLKQAVPGVMTVHCVIHRQHLVAKNLSGRLYESLNCVISAVNKIKCHSLNDRLFRQLCEEKDEAFERLLLHTEVRWLSKRNCLQRFYNLFETVIEFLDTADHSLANSLKERRTDVAYLSDIFDKLNEINTKLQGKKMNFIKTKGIIGAFIEKLSVLKSNLCRKDLRQFPNLLAVWEKNEIAGNDLEVYCFHLNKLKENMETRFQDIIALQIPQWVFNPFSTDVTAANISQSMQEPLIDLKHDSECQSLFNELGYEVFWAKKKDSYPLLWEEIKVLLLAFPSTYLVEKGFSVVTQLKNKARNKLDITQRGDLRLCLSTISPDINRLCASHQAQGSH